MVSLLSEMSNRKNNPTEFGKMEQYLGNEEMNKRDDVFCNKNHKETWYPHPIVLILTKHCW